MYALYVHAHMFVLYVHMCMSIRKALLNGSPVPLVAVGDKVRTSTRRERSWNRTCLSSATEDAG